ncbi:hypothetical protein LBHB_02865 [Leptospira borgpetersenii serovar Hardjo]|nr:hypothetical protein LBHB_02865 [Leptospira borgpetersenii serovar Hardjo]
MKRTYYGILSMRPSSKNHATKGTSNTFRNSTDVFESISTGFNKPFMILDSYYETFLIIT